MRRFLLDTNVISASSPLRAEDANAPLRDWMVAQSDRLYLPAVALGELRAGIEASRRKGQIRKSDRLEGWLSHLRTFFKDRVLPIDSQVADLAGVLFERARSAGYEPGWIDAQIAAVAHAHELRLLTRNSRHFAPMSIDFRDPFAEEIASLDN